MGPRAMVVRAGARLPEMAKHNTCIVVLLYLGPCPVCSNGTPVADMVAHSPPLPLVVDCYHKDSDIDAEDEEVLVLALEQRDRVRCTHLRIGHSECAGVHHDHHRGIPNPGIPSIISFIKSTAFVLPETLQEPHLRHLLLSGFALPIGSLLLTISTGLVTFFLDIPNPATHFQPSAFSGFYPCPI